jgi:hypothetical protein
MVEIAGRAWTCEMTLVGHQPNEEGQIVRQLGVTKSVGREKAGLGLIYRISGEIYFVRFCDCTSLKNLN